MTAPLTELRVGSLEAIRERFERAFPGEQVFATYPRHVLSIRESQIWKREIIDGGFSAAVAVASAEPDVPQSRARALAVVDSIEAGKLDEGAFSALLEDILNGARFTAASVRESVTAGLARSATWRRFYQEHEPRIRKVLHGVLGRMEDRRLRPKYRSIRLGQVTDGLDEAIVSVRGSLDALRDRMAEIRDGLDALVVPDSAEGVDVNELSSLRTIKRCLTDEVGHMNAHLKGMDVCKSSLEDTAMVYDLLADESHRYELMAAFLRRAVGTIDAESA
jgi:hypothetical protein